MVASDAQTVRIFDTTLRDGEQSPGATLTRADKLKKGKDEIIRISVESVKQARAYTDDVEFSPEDASRTELEFLEEIVHAAIEAGATTINLPDTVGYAVPQKYGEIFSHLIEKLPMIRQRGIILSAHCH